MEWGHLDMYKPDVTWEKTDHRIFFEAEFSYDQAKITEDIICASILDADQLVFVFSNTLDSELNWGGKKRALAAEYLGKVIGKLLSNPLTVKAITFEKTEDIEQELKRIGIL
jgi:hypothetical protein